MEKIYSLVTPPPNAPIRKCVFCERFHHVWNFCIFYPFLPLPLNIKSQFNFKIISISRWIINLTWGKYLGCPHALSLHLPPQHHNRVHPSSLHADGLRILSQFHMFQYCLPLLQCSTGRRASAGVLGPEKDALWPLQCSHCKHPDQQHCKFVKTRIQFSQRALYVAHHYFHKNIPGANPGQWLT